uniref:PIN domain-containing protein n=1 Tax=Sinocyclocheilus grahami TaxID=75366 RepID=A0A672PDM2_SINGR
MLFKIRNRTFPFLNHSCIVKIVREHYLREDIWSPVLQEDNLCSYPHYLIPDTNVVLHQVCAFYLFKKKFY